MAIRVLPGILRRSVSSIKLVSSCMITKGHLAVYVGDQKQRKRYVVPISYLNEPLFLDMLSKAEEEFGFNHPTGGLSIPCSEDEFIKLSSQL